MSSSDITLFQYLVQKNPTLHVNSVAKGQNTKSTSGAWKIPHIITDWADFAPESLSCICDGKLQQILNLTCSRIQLFNIAPLPFCEIHDEDSLDALLVLWSQQVVSNALDFAQESLTELRVEGFKDSYAAGRIYMARGGQAKLLESSPKDSKRRRSYPDWAAVRRTSVVGDDQSKPRNLLPGDTKLSSKWKSSSIPKGNRKVFMKHPDKVNPIIQVFNYCLKADARYGFVITDEELVVLRVGVVPSELQQEGQDSQTHYSSEGQRCARNAGKVEIKSIPWSYQGWDFASASSTLTVNLALWWLHILALINAGIQLDYNDLAKEAPTATNQTHNTSFTTGLGNLDLATTPYGSCDGYLDELKSKPKPRPKRRREASSGVAKAAKRRSKAP